MNDSDEYYNLKRSKFNNQVLSSNECSEEEESKNNIKKMEGSYYESDSDSIKSQSLMIRIVKVLILMLLIIKKKWRNE